MFKKFHQQDSSELNDITEMTADLSQSFSTLLTVAGLDCSQELSEDNESCDRTTDISHHSVGELEQTIQQNLMTARALMKQAKEKEDRGENQESEIIRMQPKLRDHCRKASDAWANLKDLLDNGCGATEEEIDACGWLRHEIDELRNERVKMYSRCRQRHSSDVFVTGTSSHGQQLDASSRHKKKTSFWKHLNKVKKHMKNHRVHP